MAGKLIAIGASRGGIQALAGFLGFLPVVFSIPVVIVLHRSHESGDDLVTLLQKFSALPVSEPLDKEPIRGGRVYLAPSGYHLLVDRDVFHLSIDEPVCFARPSVDVLFESVAHAFGQEAIGVVLSGFNRDGADGAALISAKGGSIIIQDLNTAENAEMPTAALQSVPKARIAKADEIGTILVELTS